MAVEKELKLALDDASIDAIVQFLDALSGQRGRTITLGNIYFDTPEQSLAAAKIAVRLRRTAAGWLQTLKTAGQASQGMHTRGEWEQPVAGDKLELDALLAACDDPVACHALASQADRLAPMFRTDFERTLWHVGSEGAEIEVALDLGTVVAGAAASAGTDAAGIADGSGTAGNEAGSLPIREVELELKSGPESALLAVAARLRAAVPGLRPDDISKAARGYRLLRERAAQAGTDDHANA